MNVELDVELRAEAGVAWNITTGPPRTHLGTHVSARVRSLRLYLSSSSRGESLTLESDGILALI